MTMKKENIMKIVEVIDSVFEITETRQLQDPPFS